MSGTVPGTVGQEGRYGIVVEVPWRQLMPVALDRTVAQSTEGIYPSRYKGQCMRYMYLHTCRGQ